MEQENVKMPYDELVKRLREHNGWALNETLDEAADAIEDLENKLNLWRHDKISRWIPVTERLPEEDGWYQVYAPWYSGGSSSGLKNINGNMYSAFKHGKWSIEVGYHKRPGCVKAWMPLPEPPKEGRDMSEKKPHWLYDGDCVICQHCRKAYDLSTNADRSIPTVCPFCGSEMDTEEVLKA